jgi:hypothetical protein
MQTMVISSAGMARRGVMFILRTMRGEAAERIA